MNKRMKSFNKRKAYNQVYHKNEEKKLKKYKNNWIFVLQKCLSDKTITKGGDWGVGGGLRLHENEGQPPLLKTNTKAASIFIKNHERKNETKNSA